jgi:hypothetical protein
MNRKSVIALGIAGLLAGSVVHANIVPDPGFEASDWTLPDGTATFVPSPVHGGDKAMKIVNTGTGIHTVFSKNAAVAAGQEYLFSAWVTGSNVVGEDPADAGQAPIAVVRMKETTSRVLKSDGKNMEGYRWSQVYTTNGGAGSGTYPYQDKNMQMVMQVPQGGKFVDFGIRTWEKTESGFTVWDDISFVQRTFPNRGAHLLALQAEAADLQVAGTIEHHHHDFTGTGYFDIMPANATGKLTWNNVATGTGVRIFSVRYSWEGLVRPMTLFVNGSNKGSVTPLPTGRRGIFATQDFEVNLTQATNTIRLEVQRKNAGENTAPMIDKVDVYVKAGTGGGTPPAVPGGVSASDDTFTDKVRVTWNAVIGATSYQVYRSTTSGPNGSQIGTPAGTSYDDTSAVAGTPYYYSVAACGGGGCSANSAQDPGTRAIGGGGGG